MWPESGRDEIPAVATSQCSRGQPEKVSRKSGFDHQMRKPLLKAQGESCGHIRELEFLKGLTALKEIFSECEY